MTQADVNSKKAARIRIRDRLQGLASRWILLFLPIPHLLAQVGLYEAIQCAVQYGLRIAHFVFRAVVFHHLVWVQHVRSYLASPFRFYIIPAQLGYLFFQLFLPDIVQPGA